MMDLTHIQGYCDKLGDHLMLASTEQDTSALLEEWEEEMRRPLEMHVEGVRPLSVDALERLFSRMREMHGALGW